MVVRGGATSKEGLPQPVRARDSGNKRRFAAMIGIRTSRF
jgi:hypothetical protein